MKTKTALASLILSFGLLTAALLAQQGPANGRGKARPDNAPIANPEACPFLEDGSCPGGRTLSPENCPNAIEGKCPGTRVGPNGERQRNEGCPNACPNPENAPKLDGTGGPGKPANPDGPQDGTAPGQGYRGGRR